MLSVPEPGAGDLPGDALPGDALPGEALPGAGAAEWEGMRQSRPCSGP